MDFIDEAKIYVRGGHGGKGCIDFRREKYVPKGGPDGGDGGKGGDVIFLANTQLSTLQDFKYQQHYYAPDGRPGGGAQKTGRSGEDLMVQVPVGTLIKDEDSQKVVVDLDENGKQFLLARGGRGGKGNLFFTTSTNQAPRTAQEGESGDEVTVRLELKLLADVALVGFPNAGKSTLISSISAAKPKVADYPFTTLIPHLGVVELKKANERKTFVVADIPGLIEGAHEGRGLGIRFLKHIERSRILWFVLDAADTENPPKKAYEILRRELKAFNPALSKRPHVVLLNKFDLNPDPENFRTFETALKKKKLPCYQISAVARHGLQDLLWDSENRLAKTKKKP